MKQSRETSAVLNHIPSHFKGKYYNLNEVQTELLSGWHKETKYENWSKRCTYSDNNM